MNHLNDLAFLQELAEQQELIWRKAATENGIKAVARCWYLVTEHLYGLAQGNEQVAEEQLSVAEERIAEAQRKLTDAAMYGVTTARKPITALFAWNVDGEIRGFAARVVQPSTLRRLGPPGIAVMGRNEGLARIVLSWLGKTRGDADNLAQEVFALPMVRACELLTRIDDPVRCDLYESMIHALLDAYQALLEIHNGLERGLSSMLPKKRREIIQTEKAKYTIGLFG